MISTPWAILLCKFNDDDSEFHPRKFYEDLFTASGTGTKNICMVDFFRDMSHGMLDLSRTQIFPSKEIGDWFTVDESYKDFQKIKDKEIEELKITGEYRADHRGALIKWATDAATRFHPDWPKVDLMKFYGVVVVYNIKDVDSFGDMPGHGEVVCDEYSVKPSNLGHEMGHGYGLGHSRSDLIPKDDKDADYKDKWDFMSNFNSVYIGKHPVYDSIGTPPGHPFGSTLGMSIGRRTECCKYGQSWMAGQLAGLECHARRLYGR